MVKLFHLQVKEEQPTSKPTKPSGTSTSRPCQPTVTASFDNARMYDSKSKDATELNDAVARFICKDQVPIFTVEKDGFKSLVSKLNSKYKLPSRKYFMHTEIPRLYEITKAKVRQSLSSFEYFSTTTDIWTSRTMMSYMSVTAQVSIKRL